jgi:hypothetical protein
MAARRGGWVGEGDVEEEQEDSIEALFRLY